ncbi:MAG: PQQ-binding-like beta-propeller repeat protein [Haloarculaceae archaeon]
MSPADPPSRGSGPPSHRSLASSSSPSRRAFLAAAGTTAATAVAGCSAFGGRDEPEAFHGGDWLSFGNGPGNTNRVAGGAPAPDGHETLASAGWAHAPPVVHEGVVYFAADRQVVAVEPDGTERWSRRLDGEGSDLDSEGSDLDSEGSDLDGEVSGASAVDPERGRLYVPTRGGRANAGSDQEPATVTVLSLDGGDVRDVYRVGEERTYGAAVVDGDVYARSATACVRLAPDGTERWRRPLEPLVYDEYNLGDSTATQIVPAVTGEGVYVPDRDTLVKLSPESGEERWRVPVDTAYAAPVVDDGGVVQTGWQGTAAVDHAGEVRWRRDLHSRAAAAVDDGVVYVAAGDLHELDAETGETNWQAHLPSEGTAAPVVTDESVIVAAGSAHAFRREVGGLLAPDRERWQTSSIHATAFSSPVVAADRVFVAGPIGLLALGAGADG